ncbi:MAG: HtrA protease/chaperone protein, partial [uncultured Craurococcus sp.]
ARHRDAPPCRPRLRCPAHRLRHHALPGQGPARPAARFRRPCGTRPPRRGQHRGHRRDHRRPAPARAAWHPARALLPRPAAQPAAGGLRRRLRLRHRPGRLHRHQQSCHRQCQPRRRLAAGRHGAHRPPRRLRRADRPRPAEDRGAAKPRRRILGQLGDDARRLLGARRRQSLRPRRHRHLRHRLGARAGDRRRALRRLHPDRRRHQPGQFRRPALQRRRRGDRHQHGDLLALRRLRRHRLRDALRPRPPGDRAAAARRAGGARLARRLRAGPGAGGWPPRPPRRADRGRRAHQPRRPRRAAPGRCRRRHQRRPGGDLARPGPHRRRRPARPDRPPDRAARGSGARTARPGWPPPRSGL